jgi:aminoglycoside phosphotransferase (APT) family kinase protein
MQRLHPDEVSVDAALASRLLAAQFPRWADLPLTPVRSNGTDNAMFRLGEELALRFPRREGAALQTHKEYEWLPRMAPLLPLQVPLPLAEGEPGEGFPWRWTVCKWLEGANPTHANVAEMHEFGRDMASFVGRLHAVSGIGLLPPGKQNSGRGVALAERDAEVRECIEALKQELDAEATLAAWEADLHAPVWSGEPVWIHGDITSGNLLVSEGRLSAVIDFGCMGMGDPACDLIVDWNLLPGEARHTFRQAVDVDEATWARGRGWALSIALIYIPYYQNTMPKECDMAREVIRTILADHANS